MFFPMPGLRPECAGFQENNARYQPRDMPTLTNEPDEDAA